MGGFWNGYFITVSKVVPLSDEKSGLLNFLDADSRQIVTRARETLDKEGPLLVVASGRDTIFVSSSITKVVMDIVSDRSKGFGFVTFASQDEAEKAMEEMNGKMLNGRIIFVNRAKPQMKGDYGMPIARGPPETQDQITNVLRIE